MKQKINEYRFTSGEDPSDEILMELMQSIGDQVRAETKNGGVELSAIHLMKSIDLNKIDLSKPDLTEHINKVKSILEVDE